MHAVLSIMSVVAGLALILIIVSLLAMGGVFPGVKKPGSEDYDNPWFACFLVALPTLLVSASLAALTWVWLKDPSHLAAPFLGVFLVLVAAAVMRRVFGFSLAGWLHTALSPSAGVSALTHKPWWLSKTVIVNAAVGGLLYAEQSLPQLQGFLPASKYEIAAFVLPIVNMVLRFWTTKGVSLTTPPAGAPQ